METKDIEKCVYTIMPFEQYLRLEEIKIDDDFYSFMFSEICNKKIGKIFIEANLENKNLNTLVAVSIESKKIIGILSFSSLFKNRSFIELKILCVSSYCNRLGIDEIF
jgi:hypothetical protein